MRRFKCYRQLESSDCGLTCIRMISRHYGLDIPLRRLKDMTDMTRLGISVRDIMTTLDLLRMEACAVKISPEYCLEMPLPAILHWKQNHFVVLYKVDKRNKRFHIADPARGKLAYDEEDFNSYWLASGEGRGIAIVTEPKPDFKEQRFDRERVFKRFFSYLYQFFRLHKITFIITLLFTLLIMGADFIVPVLLQKTVDEGISTKNPGLVWLLLLGQLCVAAGGLVASGVTDILLVKTGLKIHIGMVSSFLNKLARFPLSFFDRKVSSDFVQKIHDHHRIKDFLLEFPSSMLIITLSLIVFSILLYHYSPIIFLFFVGMSALELVWNALFLNKRKTLDYATFNLTSISNNKAYELANGMADLKVNNAESSHIAKWNETQEALNRTSLKSSLLGKIQGSGHSIISRVKDLSVTGIAAGMVISGDLTLGMLMTLGYITGRLSQPVSTLGASFATLQGALLSYQRIEEVIQDCGEWRGDMTFQKGEIELKGVWFKYAGTHSPYVLRDIDLLIERGKVTALVGESGCGKSTLIKLILGFYIPQKGGMLLGGNDVREVDNADWLSHCGVVMQETRIFSGTILENIALSSDEPDVDKTLEILETVGLKTFVDTLPMGVHTKIGVAGIEVSGGQKQRLMIARALYKNPDILIMDEATSSLDANTERMIVENLNRYGEGKTIIIAAHRLSTVQNADKIVFIKDGRIAEVGTHSELVSLEGDYWNLVKNQLPLSV
ncbi:MAG: peptidase domain-containing ABC transporter [Muribaculaceae bacterium]|nr:peptidase domain-containing ABC transporter [Muribaculaceae bacterium]